MIRKTLLLGCLLMSGLVFADVPVTNTADIPSSVGGMAVHVEAMKNIQSLILAVNKAQSVNGQISALQNLKDFTNDPRGAVDQVNGTVKNMLDDFNMRSGTSFGNIQDLISGLDGSTTATGMSLNLQKTTAAQLQNMNVMLQQMEAENQAVLKYRQADDAIRTKQKADANVQKKQISDNL